MKFVRVNGRYQNVGKKSDCEVVICRRADRFVKGLRHG